MADEHVDPIEDNSEGSQSVGERTDAEQAWRILIAVVIPYVALLFVVAGIALGLAIVNKGRNDASLWIPFDVATGAAALFMLVPGYADLRRLPVATALSTTIAAAAASLPV